MEQPGSSAVRFSATEFDSVSFLVSPTTGRLGIRCPLPLGAFETGDRGRTCDAAETLDGIKKVNSGDELDADQMPDVDPKNGDTMIFPIIPDEWAPWEWTVIV